MRCSHKYRFDSVLHSFVYKPHLKLYAVMLLIMADELTLIVCHTCLRSCGITPAVSYANSLTQTENGFLSNPVWYLVNLVVGKYLVNRPRLCIFSPMWTLAILLSFFLSNSLIINNTEHFCRFARVHRIDRLTYYDKSRSAIHNVRQLIA